MVRATGWAVIRASPAMSTPRSGQVEDAVTGGVARGQDRHRAPRQVQRARAGREGCDLGEAFHPGRTGAQDPQRPQQHVRPPRGRDDLQLRGLLDDLPARVRNLSVEHPDRDAMAGTQPLGATEMVGTGMGEHDRPHITRRPPDPLQGEEHVRQVTREPGVDQGDLIPVSDQQPVIVRARHQPHASGSLIHRRCHRSLRALRVTRPAQYLAVRLRIMPNAARARS